MPVAIDVRMARSSGIGTYLRQNVSRVLNGSSGLSPILIGDSKSVDEITKVAVPASRIIPFDAPIYSIREQIQLPFLIPPDAALFWAPHYNIPLLHSGRFVVTVHDVLHLARPEFVKGRHRTWYARTLFAAIKRRAEAVFCDSRFTADELRRLVGIDHKRLHVVHLGVDEKWFSAGVEGRPHPRPYFIYLGNVKPHKNLLRLVRAFRSISDEIPHDLVIVGRRRGFITGDSAAEVEADPLGSRIIFTGELLDAEVMDYVGHAEALVLPSFYEGFGLPALEGMAAGCPVLVSNAASLPEVCGSAAIYFDPWSESSIAQEMRRVAADDSLRMDMAAAGKERARMFSWDRCAAETAEVLTQVLAR